MDYGEEYWAEDEPLNWYKDNKNNKTWWRAPEKIGEHVFSFDRVTEFNLFADYPYNLTKEQKTIFDKENRHWKDIFKDRQ